MPSRPSPIRPRPADFYEGPRGPGSAYADAMYVGVCFYALAALVPVLAVCLAGAAASAAFRSARLGHYRRCAQLDRQFAKRCAERLQGLKGAPQAVWRRALRELASERDRLEDERDAAALSGQPGAAAHRAAARRRRDEAWAAWFAALERSVAGSSTPPRALLEGVPGRRGAPIRRLCEHSVQAPPSGRQVLLQWKKARGRGRVEEKIRLGSMLLDAEATVDSSLVRDGFGTIVGRRGGLREWIDENCPSLSRHYSALMGYRRLAAALRRNQGLGDPVPAEMLLDESPAAEAKLPPALRVALPRARAATRKLLADPLLVSVKAFRDRLRAAREAGRSGSVARRPA